MKQTGIIMSGDHPKLILDGSKTMTRRVIKPQPTVGDLHDWEWKPGGMACSEGYFREHAPYHCPYGQVGDRLWVRETFSNLGSKPTAKTFPVIFYKAIIDSYLDDDSVDEEDKQSLNTIKWTPSLFMPRWASRITLEITDIRVERLQEITEEDAKAEGVTCCPNAIPDHKHHFMILWDSLNAKRGYGWEVNPWVWVISFRRINDN